MNEISKSDWTLARVAHLLNRAGFGGSPAEIKELYELGPTGAVDYLVDYQGTGAGLEPPPFTREPIPDLPNRREMRDADEEQRREMQRKRRRLNQAWINQLRGWWFEVCNLTIFRIPSSNGGPHAFATSLLSSPPPRTTATNCCG